MEQLSLVSREPWWETPPRPGQDEMTCKWGWLELWSDGIVSVRCQLLHPYTFSMQSRL